MGQMVMIPNSDIVEKYADLLAVFKSVSLSLETKTKVIIRNNTNALNKYTESNDQKLMLLFAAMWETQRDSITLKLVSDSLQSGTVSPALQEGLEKQMNLFMSTQFKPTYTNLLNSAGLINTRRIASQLGSKYLFDVTNPAVVDYIKNESLKLAVDLNRSQIASLQTTLNEALVNGWGVPKTARGMQGTISLTQKQTQRFIWRYAERLKADGVPIAEINKLVEKRWRRLDEARRQTIARTELNRAYNSSNQMSMRQGIDNGLASQDTMKQRLTAGDGNVRDDHASDEGAGRIPLNEPYPATGEMFPGESSMNCRCVEIYETEV